MLAELLWPLLAALAVMAVSLSGVVFTAGALGAFVQRNLTYLATFSGGVFLLVVYHLLEETLHESASLALAAGSVLFGAALLQALHHLLPDVHHHHQSMAHDHTHTSIDGRRVLISDAFHNVGDGVLLVAAFAANWTIGIVAAIGIVIHELVQEISEYFVLREAGYSNWQALSRNFLSSATILVGLFIAAFLGSAEEIAVLFAGIAAGGFLTIMTQDLLPHAVASIRTSGGGWKHLLAAAFGVALMFSVQSLFSHEERTDGVTSTQFPSVSRG
ncbi:ZIP family metal transporter [Candidatus Kaiserbacteria bacterium]|nr:ZIP family metal transporter [Candidatus Kaiserbacteria bacterium]